MGCLQKSLDHTLSHLCFLILSRRFGNLLFYRTVYPANQVSEKLTTTSRGGPAQFAKVAGATGELYCTSGIKVWPVVHDSGELRVMVLNKNSGVTGDCQVVLMLTELYAQASLQRMTGDTSAPLNISSQVGDKILVGSN